MYKLAANIIYDSDNESNKKYIMDIDSGDLFQLNETASIIVEFIMNKKTMVDYVAFIQEHSIDHIEEKRIINDYQSYIGLLFEKGYIEEDE
ncbi:MAG: PqqD family protein [Eubacterium sp.]|nr:PqqD family protein [Eubacterium sp.]